MEVTATLCVCAIALLFQNVSSVYIDPSYDCIAPWARTFLAWRNANTKVAGGSPLFRNMARVYTKCPDFLYTGAGFPGLAASSGGLDVTSASYGPIGISILSENIIRGPLAVSGELPFLGTVALEGALPTSGSGSVSYGTGGPNEALLSDKAGLGCNRLGSLRQNEFNRFGIC